MPLLMLVHAASGSIRLLLLKQSGVLYTASDSVAHGQIVPYVQQYLSLCDLYIDNMVTDGVIVQSVATASNSSVPVANPSNMPSVITTSAGPVDSTGGPRRVSDNRRSNKPIMEKRRRARINNCLNELKALILDAMKKDPARHSKLEKADILEMTVKHLQNLQRQQSAMTASNDPTAITKFRAGYGECANEVARFPGLEPTTRRRLLHHLSTCLNQGKPEPQVQVHILPAGGDVHQSNHGILLANGSGLPLVPTRLSNGDIALLLPTNTPQPVNKNTLPLLVPIPQRTASTSSASSASSAGSSCSRPESPEEIDVYNHTPKPLSLVIRKNRPEETTNVWKPYLP